MLGMEYMTLGREHVMLRRETSHAWDRIYDAVWWGGGGGRGGGQAFHTRQRGPASTLITGCLAI